MIQFEHVVQNANGLTVSAIEELIKELEPCSSEVFFIKNGQRANARLIFNLLSLAIAPGDRLLIELFGEDEKEEESILRACLQNYL